MTSKEEALSQIGNRDFEGHKSVRLTVEEMNQLRSIAVDMYNLQYDNDLHLTEDKNILGLMGEYAFGKYYDLDFSYVFGEGDLGFDYKIWHQKVGVTSTIDVKTTNVPEGRLLIPTEHDLTADKYALVIKSGDNFGLIGGASKSDLQKAKVEELKVPSRVIPQDELKTLPPPDCLSLADENSGE